MNIAVANRLIKFKRTLFTLPFVLAGGFLPLACGYQAAPLNTWLWGLLGFTAARTSGFAFNAFIDRKIDAKNPRTQNRPLPTGHARPLHVLGIAWISLALFLIACEQISPLLFALAPLPALLIWGYSYTKRFTSLCHYVLGAIYLLIPLMAWVAVTDTFSPIPLMLGLAQASSIIACDILYAIQDRDFDLSHRIHSIPARIGNTRARWMSRLLHLITLAALILTGYMASLSLFYYVGIAILALALPFTRGKLSCNTYVALFTLGSIWLGLL